METLEIKKYKSLNPFIELSESLCNVLEIAPGDRINILKDDNGYLSIYKCDILSDEAGMNVCLITTFSKNRRVTIPSNLPRNYFGMIGDIYKIEGEPCWNSNIEKLIFELEKIE